MIIKRRRAGKNARRTENSSRARRIALASAVTVGAVLALVPAGGANAAAYDSTCDSNEVCVYNNASYATGSIPIKPWDNYLYYYAAMDGGFAFHTYNQPGSCNNVDSGAAPCRLNDSISSLKNRSDHRSVRIFTNEYYDGSYQTIGIGTNLSQVRNNDTTSSECWNDGGVKSSEDPQCTFSN